MKKMIMVVMMVMAMMSTTGFKFHDVTWEVTSCTIDTDTLSRRVWNIGAVNVVGAIQTIKEIKVIEMPPFNNKVYLK